MSSINLTVEQAGALSFICKAIFRRGVDSISSSGWDIRQDLWYAYYDVGLTEATLPALFEELKTMGFLEEISVSEEVRLKPTEDGLALNETLTANREALMTRQWEEALVCVAVRRALYGDVMKTISGLEDPKDVPFFNTLGSEFAAVIRDSYLRQLRLSAGAPLSIFDFGCGMSGLTDVFRQRSDATGHQYTLVDSDAEGVEVLSEKHRADPSTTVICADHKTLPERLDASEKFRLILAVDMLYFIQSGDDKTAAMLMLFDGLAEGGELVIIMNARPKFKVCEGEAAAKVIGSRDLPIGHPRSPLREVHELFNARDDADVSVTTLGAEGYEAFWDRCFHAYDGLDVTDVPGAARVKFEAEQALAGFAKFPDSPANGYALIIQKLVSTSDQGARVEAGVGAGSAL